MDRSCHRLDEQSLKEEILQRTKLVDEQNLHAVEANLSFLVGKSFQVEETEKIQHVTIG